MGSPASKAKSKENKEQEEDEQLSKHEVVMDPKLDLMPELLQLKSCSFQLNRDAQRSPRPGG